MGAGILFFLPLLDKGGFRLVHFLTNFSLLKGELVFKGPRIRRLFKFFFSF
jgi:hypothetical protein